VAFRPNPAIVAGAVMGTLLAAAAYIALSGAAPGNAHITEVKPINGATQSATQGNTDTVAPAAQENQTGQGAQQGDSAGGATSAAAVQAGSGSSVVAPAPGTASTTTPPAPPPGTTAPAPVPTDSEGEGGGDDGGGDGGGGDGGGGGGGGGDG